MDDLFAIEGAVFPEGHRYDVGIIWSDADPTAVLSGLRDRLAQAPSLMTEIRADATADHRLLGARDGLFDGRSTLYWSSQRLA